MIGKLNTNQAAQILKVTRRRVLALIKDKLLRASRFGDSPQAQWVIDEHDLTEYETKARRQAGRPAGSRNKEGR